MKSLKIRGGTATAQPGTYTHLGAGGGVLTLAPGIYTITDSFTTSGSGRVVGQGVLLYFTAGAGIKLSGGSTVNVTASMPDNILAPGNGCLRAPGAGPTTGYAANPNLVVYFAPDNIAAFKSDGAPMPAGPNSRQFNGMIYAPAATMQIQELDADGQVLVDTLNVHSGGSMSASPLTTPEEAYCHP